MPRPMYYSRDGTVIGDLDDFLAEMDRCPTDDHYKVRTVGHQILWNRLFVSTVFLGVDHEWFDGPPLIFETMVFPNRWWTDYFLDRYSTEAEALRGHERTVQRFQWWPLWILPLASKRFYNFLRRK